MHERVSPTNEILLIEIRVAGVSNAKDANHILHALGLNNRMRNLSSVDSTSYIECHHDRIGEFLNLIKNSINHAHDKSIART